MKKALAILTTAIALTGCAGQTWKTVQTTDEFTDSTTTMVTTGNYKAGTSVFLSPLRYYPVVRKENGQVYVGLMSGGFVKIPVGTVQLRVDQNEAWTITPAETPLSLAPAVPSYDLSSLPAKQGLAVKEAADKMAADVLKGASPYTLASGDKAKQIIKQMLAGHSIRYRTIGINQAASTTGDADLDESFRQALVAAGINPGEL